jgi:hypothetical protein
MVESGRFEPAVPRKPRAFPKDARKWCLFRRRICQIVRLTRPYDSHGGSNSLLGKSLVKTAPGIELGDERKSSLSVSAPGGFEIQPVFTVRSFVGRELLFFHFYNYRAATQRTSVECCKLGPSHWNHHQDWHYRR